MKQLVNRPLLLGLFLSIPLWIVFGNYLVAIMVALFVSFLLSMANALRNLHSKNARPQEPHGRGSEQESQADHTE